MDLVEFQIALSKDDGVSADSLLMELDRKTERENFQRASDEFGFKLVDADGIFYARRGDLASVFGMQTESSIRSLCERHGVSGLALGRLSQFARTEAQKIFNLKPTDNRTVFTDYRGFLTIGALGTTEASRKVFYYLLEMERAGRVAIGAYAIANGKHVINPRYVDADHVISMIGKVDRIKNKHLQRKAAERLDDVMDGALEIGKQASLFSGEED